MDFQRIHRVSCILECELSVAGQSPNTLLMTHKLQSGIYLDLIKRVQRDYSRNGQENMYPNFN